MILAAVSIVAIATSVLVVMVSQGRFKRRRATVVALTAAIAKLDVPQPRREPGRRTRVLASRAVTAGPNVFALDEYRRMRNARRPALPVLFEATPRSLA